MSFEGLKTNLLVYIRQRVRNGEFSEYSLARFLGVSQPHMHNVLSGIRPITPDLFDLMLARFGLDVLDLCARDDIERRLRGPAQ